MIFRAGSETVAVVSLDLLGFPSVLGDRARAMVPRLAPDRILIANCLVTIGRPISVGDGSIY
jgi:hypothetical protein